MLCGLCDYLIIKIHTVLHHVVQYGQGRREGGGCLLWTFKFFTNNIIITWNTLFAPLHKRPKKKKSQLSELTVPFLVIVNFYSYYNSIYKTNRSHLVIIKKKISTCFFEKRKKKKISTLIHWIVVWTQKLDGLDRQKRTTSLQL